MAVSFFVQFLYKQKIAFQVTRNKNWVHHENDKCSNNTANNIDHSSQLGKICFFELDNLN